jgi:hypothetical protein
MIATVTREIQGYAYARNGNAHRPTPRYIWKVVYKDRLVGIFSTARAAKEVAAAFTRNPEW